MLSPDMNYGMQPIEGALIVAQGPTWARFERQECLSVEGAVPPGSPY